MNGANDPLDPMNVPAHPEDNGAGGESLLAPWMQRELGEMLREERRALDESVRGGPPATAEEHAFLSDTRAFVGAQRRGLEQGSALDMRDPQGSPLGSPLGSPRGREVPPSAAPRIGGRTALLSAPSGRFRPGEGASYSVGPARPEAASAVWGLVAAAALLLMSVSWFAFGPGRTSREVAVPGAAPANTPTYLGPRDGDSSSTGALPPFPEPLDWSSAAPPGLAIFEVVIKDRGPLRVDEHGVLFRTESPIFETTWSCPTEVLESLPKSVDVEIYIGGQAPGSPPLWRRSYSVPASPLDSPR